MLKDFFDYLWLVNEIPVNRGKDSLGSAIEKEEKVMSSIVKKRQWLVLALAILGGGALVLSPAVTQAQEGTTTCIGSFSNTTFPHNVVVPDWQTCRLERDNVVVHDVRVGTGASLIVCPDNNIGGSIKADEPSAVIVTDQTGIFGCGTVKTLGINIGADVRVKGGGEVRLIGNNSGGIAVITRDVEIKNVQTVEIRDFNNQSLIGRDVDVKNAKDVSVTGNIIRGDLEIRGTTGTCVEQNNAVAGKTDTCP